MSHLPRHTLCLPTAEAAALPRQRRPRCSPPPRASASASPRWASAPRRSQPRSSRARGAEASPSGLTSGAFLRGSYFSAASRRDSPQGSPRRHRLAWRGSMGVRGPAREPRTANSTRLVNKEGNSPFAKTRTVPSIASTPHFMYPLPSPLLLPRRCRYGAMDRDGRVGHRARQLLRRVAQGGVEPELRAEVWPLLLGRGAGGALRLIRKIIIIFPSFPFLYSYSPSSHFTLHTVARVLQTGTATD